MTAVVGAGLRVSLSVLVECISPYTTHHGKPGPVLCVPQHVFESSRVSAGNTCRQRVLTGLLNTTDLLLVGDSHCVLGTPHTAFHNKHHSGQQILEVF